MATARGAAVASRIFPVTLLYRVPVVPRGAGGAWRLALNYLSFVASATVRARLLRRQRFDIIFVYGISPILQAIAGMVLKGRKARFGDMGAGSFGRRVWKRRVSLANQRVLGWAGVIVRWIYRHSNLLLVQSQAFVPTGAAHGGRYSRGLPPQSR